MNRLSKWLNRGYAKRFLLWHKTPHCLGFEKAYYRMKWMYYRKPVGAADGPDRRPSEDIQDLRARVLMRRKEWEARNLRPLAESEIMRQATVQIAAGMCANRTLCWEPDELAKAAVAQAVAIFKALKDHQEKTNG